MVNYQLIPTVLTDNFPKLIYNINHCLLWKGMEVQTRSDDHNAKYAGTEFFPSVKEAYNAWKTSRFGRSIWKISWTGSDGRDFRFRMKKTGTWKPESEEKLRSLSSEYATAAADADAGMAGGQIFFVNQSVMPLNAEELREKVIFRQISKKEKDREWDLGCIQEVLTEEQFTTKYCQ